MTPTVCIVSPASPPSLTLSAVSGVAMKAWSPVVCLAQQVCTGRHLGAEDLAVEVALVLPIGPHQF